jgi:tetratricopeptide (TPR) repeat protein
MALTEYQHALALDPSLNAARARLGFVLSLKADFRWFLPGETFHATIARGLAAVDSALASDSSLADGWFARCSLLWEDYGYGGHRMNQARSACERAVALEPTKAEIQNRMGFVLREFNDLQGATAHARLALRADPEWHLPHWLLAYVAWDSGDLRGAEAQWDTVERVSPSSFQWTYIPYLRGRSRLAQGDTSGVQELARLCRQRGCGEPTTVLEGLLWGRRGRADSAQAIAARLERGLVEVTKEDPYSQFDAALVRLAAGDTARAFETLRRREWRVADLLVPELAGLRGDPRYQALLDAAWQRIRTDAP